MSDDDGVEDRGTPFFVVRMERPSMDVLQRLEGSTRERVLTNLAYAVRLFRARSLPLAGSDLRLSADFGDLTSLGYELDVAIRESVDDQGALEALEPPLEPAPSRLGGWIVVCPPASGDQGVELRFAGELLGPWWYRHQGQALDLVEAVELARNVQAARGRGESGEGLLRRAPKPPLPPRRRGRT